MLAVARSMGQIGAGAARDGEVLSDIARNVPDGLGAGLKARAKRHQCSLNNETIAALELVESAATETTNGVGPPLITATVNIEPSLRRQ